MSTSIDGPYRILVVDDEALIREAFRAFLQKNGYFAIVCETLSRAKALLDEFMPHAVVVDGNLPDGPGLQFGADLKKSAKHKHIKVLAMAGDEIDVRLAEILKSQYDAILKKPFPMRDLLESLSRLLPRKEIAGAES